MSKRDRDDDEAFDEPSSKMRKEEGDDGGSGRRGRVRKKSAKVLEMEEFEQAEKTQHVTKKGKTPKTSTTSVADNEAELLVPGKKIKTLKGPAGIKSESTPLSDSEGSTYVLKYDTADEQELLPDTRTHTLLTSVISPETPLSTKVKSVKQEPEATDTSLLQQSISTKTEDQKSVIKYLLSSPSSGNKPSVITDAVTKIMAETPESSVISGKKSSKKSKPPSEKPASAKSKLKEKKMKLEIASPGLETSQPLALKVHDISELDSGVPSLKMKIFSGLSPTSAQVSLKSKGEKMEGAPTAAKQKKVKKSKQKTVDSLSPTTSDGERIGLAIDEGTPQQKKGSGQKKVSKKKEKLIQDAISAAQQMPNLAALVASPTALAQGQSGSDAAQKPSKAGKKKSKVTTAALFSDLAEQDMNRPEMSGDEAEESTLVIAETERKKRKIGTKRKVSLPKEKEEAKAEKVEKKLPKRAPTAYMLFCNTHRPAIVAANPGIEFAGISRKLGEHWQALNSKQKLQWRRKAQRRMKKGSNLISTGKGAKDSSNGPAILTQPAAGSLQVAGQSGTKLGTLLQRSPARAAPEEGPQSPTKNFSIEPIDVAAHLKLLGESLSIIGMRLQEHKGMIAVQGSLSVLLDSLLCACGPLLCLTQQVPGMDGCSPAVHGQTLDSVAYVMPGL